MRRLFALAAVIAAFAASGGHALGADGARSADRVWIDNAHHFLVALQADLDLTPAGGADVAAARYALRDASRLYTILVAYTNFDGCRHGLASVGTPTRAVMSVARTLAAACRRLDRASDLFHRAVTREDPRSLLAATSLALGTQPLLIRARIELVRLSSRS